MLPRFSAFLGFLCCIFIPSVNAQCSWTESTPAPTERFEAATLLVDEKLYVFGGWESGLVASLRVDAFDPVTETWDSVSTMPSAVTHMMANRYGQEVWFVGGFVGNHPGTATNNVWVFDLDAGTWNSGPALPAARAGGFSGLIGRRLHYVGGLHPDRETPSFDHWVLDLENIAAGWDTAAAPFDGLNHGSSLGIAGKLYCFGGQYGHDGTVDDVRDYTDVYDPATDSWTRLSSSLVNRSHQEPSTFFLDGHVFVGGGRDGSLIYSDVDHYHVDSDSWSDFCDLNSRWLAPGMRAVGSELIHSQGGQWGSGVIRDGVRKSPFSLVPDRRLEFINDTLELTVAAGSSLNVEDLLWSTGVRTAFSLSSGASWLNASASLSEVDHQGADISIQVDASSLTGGLYYGTISASSTDHADDDLVIALTVSGAVCDAAPGSPSVTVAGSSVTLNWDPVAGAIGYKVQGGEITGIPRGAKVETTTLNVTLPPGTYVWRVKAKCSATLFSPVTMADTFVVAAPRVMEQMDLRAYPNPSSDIVCFEAGQMFGAQQLEWIAVDGRVVRTEQINSGRNCLESPGLSGIYMVRLEDGRSVRVVVSE